MAYKRHDIGGSGCIDTIAPAAQNWAKMGTACPVCIWQGCGERAGRMGEDQTHDEWCAVEERGAVVYRGDTSR